MYYLFISQFPVYYGPGTPDDGRSFIFVFSSKNEESLLKKIKKNNFFTTRLCAIDNLRNFIRTESMMYRINAYTCERLLTIKQDEFTMNDIFQKLYKCYGNELCKMLNIKFKTEDKNKLIDYISFFNNLSDSKYSIEWIESPLYNMLQFSNDKEINPVIYDFINYPLFDRNVLGLINGY
jgi:hypothetical protein